MPAYLANASSGAILAVNDALAVQMGYVSADTIGRKQKGRRLPLEEKVKRLVLPEDYHEPWHGGLFAVLRITRPDGSIRALVGVETAATVLSRSAGWTIGVVMPSSASSHQAEDSVLSWHDALRQDISAGTSWRPLPSCLGYTGVQAASWADWIDKVAGGDRRRVSAEIKTAFDNHRSLISCYRMEDAEGRLQKVRDVLLFEVNSGQYLGGFLARTAACPAGGPPPDAQLLSLVRHLLQRNDEIHRQIALMLHDDLVSGLIVLKLKLERAAMKARPGARPILAETMQELAKLGGIARNISNQTWPPVLEVFGLKEALTELADKLKVDSGVECHLAVSPELPLLRPELSSTVYRIVQEAFTNVIKHAKATAVWLDVTSSASHVLVRVRDDGVGIPRRAPGGGRSIGLAGMRERTHGDGGTFSIRRSPEGGTEIKACLPLHKPSSFIAKGDVRHFP